MRGAMSRRLKLAWAVGVIVWTSVLALWALSYRRHEVFIWSDDVRVRRVGLSRGAVQLVHARLEGGTFPEAGFVHLSGRPRPIQLGLPAGDCTTYWVVGPLSFIIGRQGGAGPFAIRLHELIVPHWFVFLLTLLPVPWLWRRTRRVRRADEGRCAVCGYDLRASPQRCPECGATPAAAAAPR